MSKVEIRPITLEAAEEVASNLLPADRREAEEGHGVDADSYITAEAEEGNAVYFTMPNGKTAGMAGVEENGLIWMLCTPVIYDYPIAFVKGARGFVESRTEPLLWNVVDERNVVHLRLLKFLGFKFLQKISYGPNQLPFIEFCRVYRKRC